MKNEPEPLPVEKPPPIPVERAKGGEKTFLQATDVLVTNKRVVLGGKTYALKQITAVAMVVDHRGPKLIFGKPPREACFKSFFPLVFLIAFSYFFGPIQTNSYLVIELLRYIPLVCVLLPPVFIIISLKTPGQLRHWVEIGSASGKEKALLCNTQEEAQQISDAINNAIIDS
jgi:hypothetical protein